MSEDEIKPWQGTHVGTGVFADPAALTRPANLDPDDGASRAASGPRNGWSLNSAPLVKMCFSCGFIHRDFRGGATADDASLCPKCVAKGIAEPARFIA